MRFKLRLNSHYYTIFYVIRLLYGFSKNILGISSNIISTFRWQIYKLNLIHKFI